MKKIRLIFPALVCIALLLTTIGDTGCANIIPPEGGLRDSLPPVLDKATPGDSSKNFDAKTITLTFDEFIEIQNINQNLLITPVPKRTPDIEAKLRTITIKIKDTLEANTTYTLDFGNAIKDINEGNVMKNFSYVFSTGTYFDSLTLSGKLIMAETGKTDTTLMVILHRSGDDSAVTKQKPRYATRLDSRGAFKFRNLPAGTFYLYALKDESGTYSYMSGKQLFAFADKPVNTQEENDSIVLYAYAEKDTATTSRTSARGTTRRNITANAADKRLRPTLSLAGGQLDLLNDLVMSFDEPLKTLDTTMVHLSQDSAMNPITSGYRFSLDSTRKKLTLFYTWKENTFYNIAVEKDFAEDTLGRKLLKSDTLSFYTKKKSDYGGLRLRFKNFDPAANIVLLFLQGENIVKSVPLTSNLLSIPLMLPGEYELRVLYDRNKNGKWDPGQFFEKHIQPEIVKPLSRKSITIKANWENEFDIAL